MTSFPATGAAIQRIKEEQAYVYTNNTEDENHRPLNQSYARLLLDITLVRDFGLPG
jgi:hypothetical protein